MKFDSNVFVWDYLEIDRSCYNGNKEWKKVKRVWNPDCEWDNTCKTNMAATTCSIILSFLDFSKLFLCHAVTCCPITRHQGPTYTAGPVTLFLLLLRNICPEVSRFLFDVYNSDVRVYYLIHMSIERVYNRCSNYSEIKYSHIYIYIYNIWFLN